MRTRNVHLLLQVVTVGLLLSIAMSLHGLNKNQKNQGERNRAATLREMDERLVSLIFEAKSLGLKPDAAFEYVPLECIYHYNRKAVPQVELGFVGDAEIHFVDNKLILWQRIQDGPNPPVIGLYWRGDEVDVIHGCIGER